MTPRNEITPDDIEAIARRACNYMGCDPDADSDAFQAPNWKVMAARVQETFAINKACREELNDKPPLPPEPKAVWSRDN